jgi:hypothetical protein
MNKLFSGILAAGLALGVGAARADTEIDVGRLTAVFKEPAWKGGAEMPYNHELMSAQGTFRGKGRVFSLTGADGKPLALMYVGASYPQVHVVSLRRPCGENAEFYIRDLNDSKLENRRCVMAGGPFTSTSLLGDGGLRHLSEANKVAPLAAPEGAYFVRTHVTARGGYLIDVEVMLAPTFVGLPGAKPVAEVPATLSPGLAAWSDQLAEAAIKALTSFSGKLVVPPVQFPAN